MKRTILCLGLFVMAVLFCFSLASAEPSSNSHQELDSCILPDISNSDPTKKKEETLPLPKHLSFVQRNYLFELCEILSDAHTALHYESSELKTDDIVLKLNRMAAGKGTEDASEDKELLTLKKDLHNVTLQNVSKLTEILKRAITASALNEKVFWNAWREEKRRYEAVAGPLRTKEAHLIFKLNDRAGQLLKGDK